MSECIRVMVADDEPMVIEGLRSIIGKANRMTLVGVATSPEELFAALGSAYCDILVLDYLVSKDGVLTEPDGLYLLRQLRISHPGMRVILYTDFARPDVEESAALLGADAVLSKHDGVEVLVNTIKLVIDGCVQIRPGPHHAALRGSAESVRRSSLTRLSPRETEVVRLLAHGRSLREVAACLERSAKTISNQKRSAMLKLGLRSDIDLLRFALDSGLT